MSGLCGLPSLLSKNPYPGRGLMLGRTPDGRQAAAYFIMGRSENSRDRLFRRDGDSLCIVRAETRARGDAALILYSPVRVCNRVTIVANGDQTDTLYDALAHGGSFVSALCSRSFEPDAPHLTPRISGVTDESGYALSILKADGIKGAACERQFFFYEPLPGAGHFIHTYAGDGEPLPSFFGEPRAVAVPNDIGGFARELWDALNSDNKIALYVRFIDPDGGYADALINKRGKGVL